MASARRHQRTYRPETKAAAVADWRAGFGYGALAKRYSAPKETVRRWVAGVPGGARGREVAPSVAAGARSGPPAPPASPAALALLASRGRWYSAPHLALLDEALVYWHQRQAPAGWLRRLDPTVAGADAELRPFTRLIVSMPPRHGKSEMISKYLPAWYLGMHPDHRIILTSYNDDYARTWGRKVRSVVREYGPTLLGVSVSHNSLSQAANDWDLDNGEGGMMTAGARGAITGRGADAFIVDDPVKDQEEADSPTKQQANADWWDSTATTRFEPDAVCVVMGTRWHAKDLIGHILATQAAQDAEDATEGEARNEDDRWYELRLPALAEPGDILGRAEGEALWPVKGIRPDGRVIKGFPRRWLLRKRQANRRVFLAEYQQRPSSEESALFKRADWRFYDECPPRAERSVGYTIIDTAGYDDKTTGDYAVLATVCKVGHDLYWLDVQRGHWQFPELLTRALAAHKEHGYPILIEDTPWAKPLIQSLEQHLPGVVSFKIEGRSKLTRAQAVQPYHEAHNLYLPRRAGWVPDFIEEHVAFPTGAHDDMVDTTSMAGLRMLLDWELGLFPGFIEHREAEDKPKPSEYRLSNGASWPRTPEAVAGWPARTEADERHGADLSKREGVIIALPGRGRD